MSWNDGEGYWTPKELVLKDYAIRTHEGKTMSIHALWEFKGDEFSTFTNISGSVAGTQSLERFVKEKQRLGSEKAHDSLYQINRIARPFASKIAMCEMIHNMMRTSYFSLDEEQMKERQGLLQALTDYEFMSYRSNIYEDEEILFAMKIGGRKNWLKYKYDNKTGIGRWSQSKQINRHKKRDYDSGEFVWGIRQGMDDNTFTKYGQGLDISYEGGWRGYYREMKRIEVMNAKYDKFSKFLWTTNPEFFYNILIKLQPSMKGDFEWVNTKLNVRLQMARRRRGLEAEEEKVVGKRIKRQGEHKKPDYELSYKGKTVKASYHHTRHPMLGGIGYYSFYGVPDLEGYNIVEKTIGGAKSRFKHWVNENIKEPVDVRLQMARRRRGLEAEGITTTPLLWAGATVLTLLTLFKRS